MSDQLIELLRERFHGHEMDVPPGTWEQVTGQMAANSGEGLRESLQDKFQGHEVQVDPSAWANINAQISQGVAAGTSVHAGWIAAGVAAVVITAGLFFWNNQEAAPIASVPEAPQISLIEVPPTEAMPIAVNPEPVVEEAAPKTAPTEVSPATTAVPKATTQVEENEGTTTQESALQTESAEHLVPNEPQQEPDLRAPVKQPVASITIDPGAGQEPSQDRTPAMPASGSAPDNRVETKVEPIQEPSISVTEDDAFVWDDPFQTDLTSDILIPSAITPNGDTKNDKLEITTTTEYEKVDVRIFAARSGSLVFRSNDLGKMWDGTIPNGNIAEEGYYSCVVLLTDMNGRTHVKSMVVKLLR